MSLDPHQWSWRDEAFLMREGLRVQNALEYFSHSEFYRFFDGQKSLLQMRRRGIDTVGLSGTDFRIVYANIAAKVGEVSGSLIVLQRVEVSSGGSDAKEVFYIQGGTVFLSPTVASVLQGALSDASLSLKDQHESLTMRLPFGQDRRPVVTHALPQLSSILFSV
uniref:Mediator of RNA polymerase II transcription subunit 6 n=1 Tax=Oxyrrhis marina TaxID=2969 RepID=A0A7S3UIG9_OXYMA